MTFNVIFIPGMTKYLVPLFLQVVDSTSSRYRVIANGCLPRERVLLKRLCDGHERLEYHELPWEHILPHGETLNVLLEMEDSEYFCFMDPDIFCRGDFVSTYSPLLKQHDGVFGAPPIWCRPDDVVIEADWKHMFGHHVYTDSGYDLGCSFFAIYDSRKLSAFIRSTGVDFRLYHWSSLPSEVQAQLQDLGLEKQFYDTGKVLNILMQAEGAKFTYVDSPSLCHLGAVTRSFTGRIDRIFGGSVPPQLSLMYKHFRRRADDLKWRLLSRAGLKKPTTHETASEKYAELFVMRTAVSRYLLDLLLSLSAGRPYTEHQLKISCPQVQETVLASAAEIEEIWKEYAPRAGM